MTGALPTFLLIGAMKAGTSSLHDYLSRHPDVFMPAVKEPEFFSEDRNWNRGVEWYQGLFAGAEDAVARGEASTGYTRLPRYPLTAERIAATLPGVRLVYLLRDPLARAVSHHRHSVLAGRERRPVDEALLDDDGLLDPSRYALQLRRYLEFHDLAHVKVVFSDDLEADPTATTNDVLSFLGVSALPDAIETDDRLHVSSDRVVVPAGLRTGAAGRALRRARRMPGVESLARRLLPGPAANKTGPTPETIATVRARLADDMADLESLVGRLPAAWRQ